MTATDLTRARLAAGLEEAARLLRDHPDLPLPQVTGSAYTDQPVTLAWYLDIDYDDPTDQAAAWLRVSALAPGRWEHWRYEQEGERGWMTRIGQLRLVVTYRLAAEAAS